MSGGPEGEVPVGDGVAELVPVEGVDPLPADIRAAVEAATTARVFLPGGPAAYDTGSWLRLRADHAAARDAVHSELDLAGPALAGLIDRYAPLVVETAAPDAATYLTRPDLGRRLSPASIRAVEDRLSETRPVGDGGSETRPVGHGGSETRPEGEGPSPEAPDAARAGPARAAGTAPEPAVAGVEMAVVVGDGLSATAVEAYGPQLVEALVDGAAARGWRVRTPIVVVRRCRVGILNDLGPRLSADVVILLVGERPGLAAADSLSAYLGYRPRTGHTDADRNLVSGIHDRGTPVAAAARRVLDLAGLLLAARRSGVTIKEELAAVPARALTDRGD